ncbi:TspO and MBR related proteins [Sphingomonas jatrophae]|uniref:TspO and MBR related proteins n=1 Tax=Sphingomonas jatrophae TaxID=1166337 RepID=A0A1I6M8R2_9SPHN|nr:TspO and MBR related proteins [Sphingomonas jatrophae]
MLVPLVVLLGAASGRLSGSGTDNAWFAALTKPSIMPPGAAFGIVWTILYLLMGVALAMVVHARGARGRGLAIALFVVQFAVNLAWSPLFFAAHQVSLAFWWILLLIPLAAATAWAFFRVRRVAGLLLLPYIAWLLFAAVLNHRYDVLNPDAERLAPDAASTQVSI